MSPPRCPACGRRMHLSGSEIVVCGGRARSPTSRPWCWIYTTRAYLRVYSQRLYCVILGYQQFVAWGEIHKRADWLRYTLRYSRTRVRSSGHSIPRQRKIVVTIGSDEADARATILREMAHAVLPEREGHGLRWQRLFALAATEAFGRVPQPAGRGQAALHRAVVDAARRWLRRLS